MYPNTECVSDCYRPGDCDGSCTHPRPVAVQQQPHASHGADAFRNMFAILHNLDRWELEEAGLIAAHDDDKWTRFNSNLTTFVLKLDDARLDALYSLVQERQPARYRSAGEVV